MIEEPKKKIKRSNPALTKKLANSMERWRIARGLSKRELARRLDISITDLRKSLKGNYGMSCWRITNVCFVLEITPNDLFDFHKPIKWSPRRVPN